MYIFQRNFGDGIRFSDYSSVRPMIDGGIYSRNPIDEEVDIVIFGVDSDWNGQGLLPLFIAAPLLDLEGRALAYRNAMPASSRRNERSRFPEPIMNSGSLFAKVIAGTVPKTLYTPRSTSNVGSTSRKSDTVNPTTPPLRYLATDQASNQNATVSSELSSQLLDSPVTVHFYHYYSPTGSRNVIVASSNALYSYPRIVEMV
ncbi:hypothetical protein BGZ81_010461 [Podila clonocystis]|nr:hypothetical protein BGZ81_010461 [Podila clonocystis]